MTVRRRDDAEIHAQACEWLVTLKDPEADSEDDSAAPEEQWQAFGAWFTQSPAHFNAFIEAIRISTRLSRIDPHHLVDIEALLRAPQDNVVPLGTPGSPARPWHRGLPSGHPETSRAQRWRRLPRKGYGRWLSGLAAALTAGFLTLFCYDRLFASTLYYSSGIGQRLFVPLEDGSSLQLNTRSRVAVQFTRTTREVRLLEGEALFDVRHDSARPFSVIVDGVIIKDRGTQFSVYRRATALTVAVIQGQVDISGDARLAAVPAPSAGGDRHSLRSPLPTTLSAGERAEIMRSGSAVRVTINVLSDHELARQLAWKEGWLSFQGETLGQAVEEINRYNRRQFEITDPVVASWQVGGNFQATDPDTFATMLTRTFAVRLKRSQEQPNLTRIERAPNRR